MRVASGGNKFSECFGFFFAWKTNDTIYKPLIAKEHLSMLFNLPRARSLSSCSSLDSQIKTTIPISLCFFFLPMSDYGFYNWLKRISRILIGLKNFTNKNRTNGTVFVCITYNTHTYTHARGALVQSTRKKMRNTSSELTKKN